MICNKTSGRGSTSHPSNDDSPGEIRRRKRKADWHRSNQHKYCTVCKERKGADAVGSVCGACRQVLDNIAARDRGCNMLSKLSFIESFRRHARIRLYRMRANLRRPVFGTESVRLKAIPK